MTRLTRLYMPDQEFAAEMQVLLHPEQAHYLLRVLRMESGQEIVLFNAQSGGWLAALDVQGKKAIAVLQRQIQSPTKPHNVHMILAPLKKEAWLFAIEKVTELGACALQPMVTDYTQHARVNADKIIANMIEASQQCERTDVPAYDDVQKLDTILKNWDASRVLYVALERTDAQPALDAFDVTQAAAIMIGPEGGFSQREKDLFARYDFVRPVSLGSNILRAETAALSALAIWAGKSNSQR